MIKIGLTGNIGSGKSTVSNIFKTLGVPLFYADKEAKELYSLDIVKKEILIAFSTSAFNTEGQINFKSLAKIVFNNKTKLKQLTDILHPLVFSKYHAWAKENSNSPYSIHESAIIFEYGQQKYFDKIICVICPTDLRIQRAMKRDNTSFENIKQRIDNQMAESEKIKLSDFIIDNGGHLFLIPQVMEIHELWTNKETFLINP